MRELFYPEFVPNQILTDRQLNQLRDYLASEGRLTRTRLVGIGIACGLGLRAEPAAARLVVRPGVGITSDGYLISFCTQQVYTHFVSYVDPDRDEQGRVEYTPWRTADGTGTRDIKRLVSSEEMASEEPPAGALPLTAAMLNGSSPWVVALYLEYEPVELNSCLVTACDNKGQNINLNVRALLVLNVDVPDWPAASTAPPALRAPRLHAVQTLAAITNAAALNDAYRRLIIEMLPGLRTAITDVFAAHRERFELPVLDVAALTEPLLQNVDQYRYDALKDLVRAYNEAMTAACSLATSCCPSGNFPRHLLLGAINGSAGSRHTFLAAGVRDELRGECDRVRRLFLRLQAMLHRLHLGLRPAEVRIAPSHAEFQPLGNRAMPYYFEGADVQALWQPRLTCTTEALWTNWNWATAGRQDVDHDDYSRATWLRIEGHVGRECAEVQAELNQVRVDQNAEFDHLHTWLQDPAHDVNGLLEQMRAALQARHLQFATLREVIATHGDWQGAWRMLIEAEARAAFLALQWHDLRRRRVLHCDFGSLQDDYAKIRSSMLCTLGRLTSAARRLRVAALLSPDIPILDEYYPGIRALLIAAMAGAMQSARTATPTPTPVMRDGLDLLRNGPALQCLSFAFQLWAEAIAEHAARVRLLLPQALADFDLATTTAMLRDLVRDTLSFELAWLQLGNWVSPARGSELPPAAAELRSLAVDLAVGGRTCLLAQLAVVSAKYEAIRAADTSLFANLVARQPGIEHLAGVGKGGTFITVGDTIEGAQRVVADFALAGRIGCCCPDDLQVCIDPTATVDVRAFPLTRHNPEGPFDLLSTVIDVRANDFDPNFDDGVAPPEALSLLSERSDLGGQIGLDGNGWVRYLLDDPSPGAIDRFSYQIAHRDGQCESSAIGEVLVLFVPPPGRTQPRRPGSLTVSVVSQPAQGGPQRPVPGAQVQAVSTEGLRAATQTDAQGIAHFAELAPAHWRVTVSQPNFGGQAVEVDVGEAEDVRIVVNLRGAFLRDGNVPLLAAARLAHYESLLNEASLPADDETTRAATTAFIARLQATDFDPASAVGDYRNLAEQTARIAQNLPQAQAESYKQALKVATLALTDFLVAHGDGNADATAVAEMKKIAVDKGLDANELHSAWQGEELERELGITVDKTLWRTTRRAGATRRKSKK